MVVRVRLFAMLRERAGSGEIELELPEGARVRDALAQVEGIAAGLPLVMAVNREYADDDAVLSPGDELALIPPVSGGADVASARHALVTDRPLDPARLLELVRDPGAGAVVTFLGVTREVDRLEYEAYADMAQARIARILDEVVERCGLRAAAAEHRVGEVPLSEPSIAVVVSAAHRDEAFAGAREIVDRIKAEAPIWKKEVSEAGERWVEGTSPAP
jgi:molybdopterin synthase catalytic subunit